MQTLLPYSSYSFTAQHLDNKRLNKQILECYQILKVLSQRPVKGGWVNHPAVLMWKNHELHLYAYAQKMIKEAKIRGIRTDKNSDNLLSLHNQYKLKWGTSTPDWLLDKDKMSRIVATHRARLYVKDPEYYADFAKYVDNEYNKPCCEGCNYYWPTHPRKKK